MEDEGDSPPVGDAYWQAALDQAEAEAAANTEPAVSVEQRLAECDQYVMDVLGEKYRWVIPGDLKPEHRPPLTSDNVTVQAVSNELTRRLGEPAVAVSVYHDIGPRSSGEPPTPFGQEHPTAGADPAPDPGVIPKPKQVEYVEWSKFWERDPPDDHALIDNVLIKGRGHAFFAKHKTGKSLFMLWAAAKIATGSDKNRVVYFDYEMTADDLQERLEDMGYGAADDLSRLHYALLPTLPPLDLPNGGAAVCDLVDALQAEHPDDHIVVIIDTASRALQGDENEASTYQAFYRYTGIKLKQRGCTWARLDHEGKDSERGMRGSSAKGDDIDIAWQLAQSDDGLTLKKALSRVLLPDRVDYHRSEEPLDFRPQDRGYIAGTSQAVKDLDALDVDLGLSVRRTQMVLREAGTPHRRQVVGDAVRYRRERVHGEPRLEG